MAVQQCEYTKCHCTKHFKIVNFMWGLPQLRNAPHLHLPFKDLQGQGLYHEELWLIMATDTALKPHVSPTKWEGTKY